MLDRMKSETMVTSPLAVTAATVAVLKSGPPAPEFAGITQWLNGAPVSVATLRGKVVLVDFWTYACSDCISALTHVNDWNEKYAEQGLATVGVHTPEFPFEHDTENVRNAIGRLGITHHVAQDNEYATWAAYDNQYWPAFYLIDRKGEVVYTHFGEGGYAQTEAAIQAALAQHES